MRRDANHIISAVALATLLGCGGKSSDEATTPIATEPAAAEPTAAAEPPAPAPAEPPPAPPAPTYQHGKWVWFELNSPDVAKSKAFYTAVFGWTIEDKEMGGMTY